MGIRIANGITTRPRLHINLGANGLGEGFKREIEYAQFVRQIRGSDLLAHWSIGDQSGTTAFDSSGNGYHGVHTGVTLGQSGIGDGWTSGLYDGSTDFTNVHSAALATAFSGLEGTMVAWANIPSAAWTDGAVRQLFSIQVDANNFIRMRKSSTNNIFNFQYSGGGTLDAVNIGNFAASTWVHLAQTWSASGDAFKAFFNGVQQGTAQSTLGAFSGNPAATTTAIGAISTTPSNVWSGNIAHVSLFRAALTAGEIKALYQARG